MKESMKTEPQLPMRGLLHRVASSNDEDDEDGMLVYSTPKTHQKHQRLIGSVDQSGPRTSKQMCSIHDGILKDNGDDDDQSSVYSFDSILPSPPSVHHDQDDEKNVFHGDEALSVMNSSNPKMNNIHHLSFTLDSNSSKRNFNNLLLSKEKVVSESDEEESEESDDELSLFSMKKSKKKVETNKKRKVSQSNGSDIKVNLDLMHLTKLETENIKSHERKLVIPSLILTQQQVNTKDNSEKSSQATQENDTEKKPLLEQSEPSNSADTELILDNFTPCDNVNNTMQENLVDEEYIVSLTPELEEKEPVTVEPVQGEMVNQDMNDNNTVTFTQAHHVDNIRSDNGINFPSDAPLEDILYLDFIESNSPNHHHSEKQNISEDEETNIEVIVPKKMIDICTQTDKIFIPSYTSQNDLGDKNNICSICLNVWSSTGLHQVCCLGCGHLFGKNCIEKWLKKNSTCPKCKKTADRSHIRLLYIDNLSAVDSQRLDQLEKQLEHEVNLRKTLENMKNGLELRVKMLMEQLGQPGAAVLALSPNTDSNVEQKETDQKKSLIQRSLELAERKKRDFILNDHEGSRVIQSSKSKKKGQFPRKRSSSCPKQIFQLSLLEKSSLIEISNPSLGSKAVSLLMSFESKDKTCGFYSFTNVDQLIQKPSLLLQSKKIVHNSPLTCIRAHYLLNIDGTNNFDGYSVNISSSNTHLILTSSLDRTIRITDSRQSGVSNSVCFCPYLTSTELEYDSITCCEWNRSNVNYCFASLSNGSILCYDIRKPSEPFLTTGDKSHAQLHSMFHVPNVGLIVSNSSSIRCYDENYSGYTKSYNLFSGNITSLQFNHVTNTCMFVGKENSKQSTVQFFKLNDKIQAICTDTLDINYHKEELLLGRSVFTSSAHNNNTLAVPKTNDHCVEIYRSYGDKEFQLFTEIVESDNSPYENVALFNNNLFLLSTHRLAMYQI
nr:unnamed protein product [Naegleria fowleri]